jgi:pantothenate kinase
MTGAEIITLDGLADLVARKAGNGRLLVALAGPPGSGKSTCAEKLNAMLNGKRRCRSAVFQMDGYHLDDGILIERGLRPRKGAPETFDVVGFGLMLERLKRNEEDEIAVPVFDRGLEISRAGARMISRNINILIVEGNYLMLDRAPWNGLKPLFDITANIDVPEAVLRQRLYDRWEGHGIPADEIPRKVEENDMVNCLLVLAESQSADFIIHN